MNTTLTAICRIPGTGRVMTPRRVNARLAPGGREVSRERDTRVARTPATRRDGSSSWGADQVSRKAAMG